MNICFFNWVSPDDPTGRGGGVTVYQKNIMQKANIISGDVFFISSGSYYTHPFSKVYFVKDNNNYKIYNSKVLAPASDSHGSSYQLSEQSTELVFIDILKDIGQVDVIHFNNLEGIPLNLLKRIKDIFPKIKIVYSVHNYYPICPNVALWKNDNENCKDYNLGEDCVTCGYNNKYLQTLKKYDYQNKKTILLSLTRSCIRLQFSCSKKNKNFNDKNNKRLAEYFGTRREQFIHYINMYVDKVLCVSKRVKELCHYYGINEQIMETQYIGTEHAKLYESSVGKSKLFSLKRDQLTIGYLGYMRKDKGFEFFLDCLTKIPEEYVKKINLVIAARNTNTSYYDAMNSVSRRFNSFAYYDGYNHNNLDLILNEVDLGIIPPVWEDNLPQVAIELHCRKIPILCSNAGGASELNKQNVDFTFEAGSSSSFLDKLGKLIVRGYSSDKYWNNVLMPITMEEHLSSMRAVYLNLLSNK